MFEFLRKKPTPPPLPTVLDTKSGQAVRDESKRKRSALNDLLDGITTIKTKEGGQHAG